AILGSLRSSRPTCRCLHRPRPASAYASPDRRTSFLVTLQPYCATFPSEQTTMTGPRTWILDESHWKDVQRARTDVVVLPWGATEAHNYHLPSGTDTLQASNVASEAARRAVAAGARVMVLPAIPFGVQTGQLDIPFCININPATQAAVLRDIVASLEPHGSKALVVLN